ncbi:MAG: peptidoglycan-binding protein [Acidimicrobiales bacterium]
MNATVAEATVDHPGPAGTREERPYRRKARRVIAVAVVLVGAGVAVVITRPFSTGEAGSAGVAENTDATGISTVARQDLSSETQVPATLGYAGSYTIAAPSGASAQQVAQAQQAVAEDQLALSADQQSETAKATADNQSIAAAQTNLNTAQSTLTSDQANQAQACAGTGASGPACSQDTQKVSQDQTALTQAQQQLASAQSTATQDHDQAQVQVASDQLKLQGDQATVASLQATAVNPGTTYTALPAVGDVVSQNKPLYSVSNEPVSLLYGTIPAYRAFYVGMSDGADVGELTADLIALGYGAGLTQSNDYSTATASAVKRWQSALGLPATGQVLLGQVVFEPGPIRVTSVTPSVGQSVGGGGASASGSSGGGGGGGGTVLTATSTTRQVSIALDASEQSEVAVGDKVTITLPSNQTTPGVISSVGTVATTPSSSGAGSSGTSESSSPTITVLVKPTDPAATGSWDQASVNVTITTGTVTNALVVPVAALRARTGGGYAVEVVGADSIRRLVPVTLGLFDDADGLVQVTGTSLAAGQQVVVPKL